MDDLNIDFINILEEKYIAEYTEIMGLEKFIKESKTPVYLADANYFRGRLASLNNVIDEVTIGLQEEIAQKMKDDTAFQVQVEKICNSYRRYKGKRFPPSSPFYKNEA